MPDLLVSFNAKTIKTAGSIVDADAPPSPRSLCPDLFGRIPLRANLVPFLPCACVRGGVCARVGVCAHFCLCVLGCGVGVWFGGGRGEGLGGCKGGRGCKRRCVCLSYVEDDTRRYSTYTSPFGVAQAREPPHPTPPPPPPFPYVYLTVSSFHSSNHAPLTAPPHLAHRLFFPPHSALASSP